MRTNIEIDDELMKQVMKETGAPTKKAAVEASLRLQLAISRQSHIRALKGKVVFFDDPEQPELARAED